MLITHLILFVLFERSWTLYFHIAETEKKCFIEEIPDETMVMGRYKVQLYDPNTKAYGDYPTIGMHVEAKDPEEKVCRNVNHTGISEERRVGNGQIRELIIFYN